MHQMPVTLPNGIQSEKWRKRFELQRVIGVNDAQLHASELQRIVSNHKQRQPGKHKILY
jgi:hypothetical protein